MFKKCIRASIYCTLQLVLLAACNLGSPAVAPTATPPPTATPLPPTLTPPQPTETLTPTATPLPQTLTPPPPTDTPLTPTATPLPPTLTPPPTTPSLDPTRPNFVNPLIYGNPAMLRVTIKTEKFYTFSDPAEILRMDIFYPPNRPAGTLLPVVIFPNPFPLTADPEIAPLGRRSYESFQAYGRMFAANGLAAVAYDTLHVNDLEAVVKHLQDNSARLGIDSSRLGFFSISSWAALASSFAYQENRSYLKFVVFYYGFILTPENAGRKNADDLAVQYRFYGPELPDVTRIRTNLPVLVVRCGKNDNESTDQFIQGCRGAGRSTDGYPV